MYGAIFGDIIGSRFEFDAKGWSKEFELFTRKNSWTDDSVMTIAVAEALMNAGKEASVDSIKTECIKSMKKWGQKYPYAGYGARFISWVLTDDPKPYGSLGNGSAMRVSAAGWLYDSLERTREVARATAEVTHNHPEGIKGAECTAAVMFLARTGVSKEEIKEYVIKEFGYDLSKSVDEIRPFHKHDETCMDALPKALVSFFEGTNYEDVVRNAVSLGGDTDTIAAIAGAMGEAMYGMPIIIYGEGKNYLEKDMLEVTNRFDDCLGRNIEKAEADPYEKNKYIKMAVNGVYSDKNEQTYGILLDVIMKRMLENGEAPTPMDDKNNYFNSMDIDSLTIGTPIKLTEDVRLTTDKMKDGEGKLWVPLFTDEGEIEKGPTTNIRMNMSISSIVNEAANYDKVEGLVINPYGQALTLPKEILKIIINAYEKNMEALNLKE